MTAFVRRFRTLPPTEDLVAIEQIATIDRTPATPVVGVGYGTLLIVGEFEDGPFNEPTEVFGETDEAAKFGAFGYQYGDIQFQNPCARTRLGEIWNGNGWIKGLNLKPKRKIICRVDTSVGDVRFSLAAALRSEAGPFSLAVADALDVTTDVGGPASSTPITAAAATRAGAGFVSPTLFSGGERIGITVDALSEVIVTFQSTDQLVADVILRINNAMGYTAAVLNGVELDLSGIQQGSGGSITLRDVDIGTLAQIGHSAGTTAGTGNVANVAAVTPAEAAALINSVAVGAINGVAVVDSNTQQVVVYRTGSTAGTIQIDDGVGTMASVGMGFTTGTVVTGNVGDAFDVLAGTRVRNAGGDEWVTMRKVSWPEGTVSSPNVGTQDVEVRDATDDGSGTGAIAGTVTTIVDYPSTRYVEVTNPGNLSVALTQPQIDLAYEAAFDVTTDPKKVSRYVTASISARRSEAVVRAGRQNAIDASAESNQGRIFYTRAPQGYSSAQATADVANYRRDRVVYSWPNWTMTVTEIAAVGTAGGTGFTEDGVIPIGADGPRAYIDTVLNPEENGCQRTGLLTFITDIEDTGEVLNRQLYTSLKAAGICAARIDFDGNYVYQSDVTTDLTAGRTTIKRRKMADFIQDSQSSFLLKYSKQLATDNREAAIDADLNQFLSRLKSEQDPDKQRISDFSVEDTRANNPDLTALGITTRKVLVRLLASLDTIVIDTEIGEGVVVSTEA